jgi:hypothetical protein
MRSDPKDNLALFGFSRNDGRLARLPSLVGKFGEVQTQIAFRFVQAMASKTALGQNRTNLPVEVNFSKQKGTPQQKGAKWDYKSFYFPHERRPEHSLDDH